MRFLILTLLLFNTPCWAQNKLLVLGDSLSAAYNMPLQQGWVALLEEELDGTNCLVEIVNASISGETSIGGLTRLPKLLELHNPSIVIVELGANDGLRGLPVLQLRQNLEQIIHLSRTAGARVLLLGIRIPTNYGRRYGEAFADVYPEIAAALELPLVPFLLEGIAQEPSLMQADTIHPNAIAQPMLAQTVTGPLRRILDCSD